MLTRQLMVQVREPEPYVAFIDAELLREEW
jgi:hypothetical protein